MSEDVLVIFKKNTEPGVPFWVVRCQEELVRLWLEALTFVDHDRIESRKLAAIKKSLAGSTSSHDSEFLLGLVQPPLGTSRQPSSVSRFGGFDFRGR